MAAILQLQETKGDIVSILNLCESNQRRLVMSKKFGGLTVLLALVVAAAFMVVVFGSPVLAAQKAKTETISGTVVELHKDKSGKVTQVGIKTDKEGDYMVGKKGKGADLMKMVDKKVEVTGAVKESKGKKTIDVTEYKVME
jgi:copper(I)-binding protein